MIKAAFFDIDGTLLSFKTHLMPASTKAALVALRRAGVKCFVASGRPKYQFPPCIANGFDGFVTLTGSYCYDAGGVYADVPLSKHDVETVVRHVHEGRYEVLAMEGERSYVSAHSPEICAIEQKVDVYYDDGNIDDALANPIYQFCAFVSPAREHEVADALEDAFTTRWNDLFCDVVPKASSKPAGIRATLDHWGLDASEAIAFGDGGNDATMLEYCGIGVAMGNGTDAAKAAADYVTDDIDDDGLMNACRHLGII